MTRSPLLPALPLALLAAALAAPARAQGMACASHDAMTEHLAEGWGEARQSIGLASDGAVMEVFASAETGTWTIAVTRPGGPTCIVAAGEHWELVAEALPPPGEGA